MKRVFDFTVALIVLILLLPIMLLAAIFVKVKLGNPILFRQLRPGLGGQLFYMFKFRSMLDTIDSKGQILPDSKRLTPFGKMLRATSIDELPGLVNVLKGDMSLVGPRPLLVEYLPLYSKEQSKRHDVRPGITGLAQVNGRNAISWDKKFEYDVWYVDNQSFLLDLKILLLTFKKVFFKENISADGEATMTKFEGSKR